MPVNKTITVLGCLLFLSLVGNLFMGGILAGDYAASQHMSEKDKKAHWKKREEFLQGNLSAADYDVLKNSFAEGREKMKESKVQMDAARNAVEAATRAEPFDQQALEAALHTEQELKVRFIKAMREKRAEAVKQLSPQGQETMKKMTDKFGDRMSKWRERREGRRDPHKSFEEIQSHAPMSAETP